MQSYYIKFATPAANGEVTISGHTNEIEVLSFGHSFTQPQSPTRSSAGSGTVEQATHAEFTFTKYTDAATDDLLKACWSGQQFGTVTFTAYRADGSALGVCYLQIVFTGVVISSFSISGSGGDLAQESVGLTYNKVTYTYTQQKDSDGTGGGAQPTSHDLIGRVVS